MLPNSNKSNHNAERMINILLSYISFGFGLIGLFINFEDPGVQMFSALFLFFLSSLFIVFVPFPQVRQKGHSFLICIFRSFEHPIIRLSIKRKSSNDGEDEPTRVLHYTTDFCFTFSWIIHTKQMPFNALLPLYPHNLPFCPPPPDMFIYRGASCANKLFTWWTTGSQEKGSNRSGTAKPLQSSTPTPPNSSLELAQPLEGFSRKALPSGGLRGRATACVTHPLRLRSSWMVPLITGRAHMKLSF